MLKKLGDAYVETEGIVGIVPSFRSNTDSSPSWKVQVIYGTSEVVVRVIGKDSYEDVVGLISEWIKDVAEVVGPTADQLAEGGGYG